MATRTLLITIVAMAIITSGCDGPKTYNTWPHPRSGEAIPNSPVETLLLKRVYRPDGGTYSMISRDAGGTWSKALIFPDLKALGPEDRKCDLQRPENIIIARVRAGRLKPQDGIDPGDEYHGEEVLIIVGARGLRSRKCPWPSVATTPQPGRE